LNTIYAGPKRGADRAVLLAHGAGSDMHAATLARVADALAGAKIPSLRFNYPYRDAGRKSPDRAAVLDAATREAAAELARQTKLPPERLVLGGRSMEVVHDADALRGTVRRALAASDGVPVLVDEYLMGIEVEVDAVTDGETVVVPDVNAFPGHIACDAASRSEIVVPIFSDGELVGVLDVDAPEPSRFDERDRAGLERFVKTLERRIEWTALSGKR